jgi:hypothetical protein
LVKEKLGRLGQVAGEGGCGAVGQGWGRQEESMASHRYMIQDFGVRATGSKFLFEKASLCFPD